MRACIYIDERPDKRHKLNKRDKRPDERNKRNKRNKRNTLYKRLSISRWRQGFLLEIGALRYL